jgi:diguanylate cyclase (GGDEF)-like protein/PAS domain S-box-containing protein
MLSEISCRAVLESEFRDFLSKVCASIRKSFNYHSVQIWIATGNRLDIIGHSSKCEMTPELQRTFDSIVREAWDQNRILSKNYSQPERSGADEGIGRSCFAVPMHLQNDRIGVLFIESTFPDAFSSDDIGVHKGMASIIASRYASVRLLKDYQRSGEYLKTILESADDWAIIFTDSHGYILSCSVGVEKIFKISQKEAVGKDFLNMFAEEKFQRELLEFMKSDNGSQRFRNHKVAQEGPEGTAYFGVSFQRVFGPDKKQIGFVGIVQNITDKVENESRLKQESLKDGLTGLYNQQGFARAINRTMKICRKLGCNLAICFMDLDHLKRCNDTHGHLYGSRVIKEAGEIMQKFVRPQDTCSRYGGDEFVIIMPQCSKQQALPVAEKIRASICEHFGEKITGSFGIADLSDNATTLTDLIAKADEALYTAKSLGRNRVVVAD